VDHGLYVRAGQSPVVPEVHQHVERPSTAAAVVLVGCVRTKRASPSAAAELFDSPLFVGRRRYAVASGHPWYILSAKFGLLAPSDVIGPYDVYLADQRPGYKKAWGEFVAAQLDRMEHDLRGQVVEVHAGAAYVDPLRAPLGARGARLATPLAHLGLGEQLAWYARNSQKLPAPPSPAVPEANAAGLESMELIRLLTDRSKALSPQALLGIDSRTLAFPGLYSWWVDEQGSADLSRGLGQPLAAGLIYAGQAGATRWPSGKRSSSTLWTRIAGMHLGGSAEFSTFRRTLAAALAQILGLAGEDDPGLSEWISAHLCVIPVPMPDADRLGEIESVVLDALDPPLNLRDRPSSAVRRQLSGLRQHRWA
jgi:hypothetical protein